MRSEPRCVECEDNLDWILTLDQAGGAKPAVPCLVVARLRRSAGQEPISMENQN